MDTQISVIEPCPSLSQIIKILLLLLFTLWYLYIKLVFPELPLRRSNIKVYSVYFFARLIKDFGFGIPTFAGILTATVLSDLIPQPSQCDLQAVDKFSGTHWFTPLKCPNATQHIGHN
jgi:hypothetical protein